MSKAFHGSPNGVNLHITVDRVMIEYKIAYVSQNMDDREGKNVERRRANV